MDKREIPVFKKMEHGNKFFDNFEKTFCDKEINFQKK